MLNLQAEKYPDSKNWVSMQIVTFQDILLIKVDFLREKYQYHQTLEPLKTLEMSKLWIKSIRWGAKEEVFNWICVDKP